MWDCKESQDGSSEVGSYKIVRVLVEGIKNRVFCHAWPLQGRSCVCNV